MTLPVKNEHLLQPLFFKQATSKSLSNTENALNYHTTSQHPFFLIMILTNMSKNTMDTSTHKHCHCYCQNNHLEKCGRQMYTPCNQSFLDQVVPERYSNGRFQGPCLFWDADHSGENEAGKHDV